MLKLILERLGWAIAFTVLFAFFLPWLKSKPSHLTGSERPESTVHELVADSERTWLEATFTLREREISDALTHPFEGTNGFSLLLLARNQEPADREKAKRMVSFLGSMDTRSASILIYAVPACALIGACFLTAAQNAKGLFLVPAGLCGLLYVLMKNRLNDTYFDRLAFELSAGLGLWISLYGLLIMILLLLLRMVLALARK